MQIQAGGDSENMRASQSRYRALVLCAALVTALLVPSTADAAGQENNPNCDEQVDRTIADFDEAFLERDMDRYISFFHENATLITPTGPVLMNPGEIRESREGLFARDDWTFSVTEIKKVLHACKTAQLVTDGVFEFPALGIRLDFVNTLTLVREHNEWKILMDQSTRKVT